MPRVPALRNPITAFFTLLAISPLFFSAPALAIGAHVAPTAISSDNGTLLEVDGMQIAPASLENKQGRYGMTRLRTAITYGSFTLGYTRREFQWQAVENLPFGNGRDDPWTGFNTLELKATRKGPVAGQWRYNFSAEVSSSFETELGSPSLDILAAGGYNFSPRFKVRFGLAMLLHEVRTVVVPLAALKWWGGGKSAEEPLFSVLAGLPETIVTYHWSPRLDIAASLLVDSKVSRLADDSVVAVQGFAETRDIVSGIRVRFKPTPAFTVSAGLGYDAFRRLTLHDREGDEIAEYDVDGGWAGRFTLDYRF